MSNYVKKHWFILIPAFIVGIMIVLPTIISVVRVGQNFSGIYPIMNNDEAYYLSTTREFYDRHSNSGNPFIKELEGEPSLQSSFAEAILSSEAKILGFSVPKVFALNDFLLPFLGVILLYVLFFNITKHRVISGILSFIFFIIFLFSFNRPVSPQFNFLFFLLGLLFLYKIFSKDYDIKGILKLNICFAIIFSILVYLYPFYWTAIIVLYAVNSFFLVILNKNYLYYIKNWAVFTVVSGFLVLPYILNLIKSTNSQFFIEASLRNGFIFTHFPGAFINVAMISFCLPVLYLIRKNITDKRELLFGYSLVASGVILNWQNVVTGKALQFSSHYYLIMILFIFIIIAIFVKIILEILLRREKLYIKEWVAIFLMIILTSFIFYKQKSDFLSAYENIIYPPDISGIQSLAPVAQWLNANTPKASVVYSLGKNYDWFLPIYTHNNSYFQTYAGMYLISNEELENRWVIQKFFDGVAQSDVMGNRSIWINRFIDTYLNKEVRRKILQFITTKKYPETVLMEQKDIDRVLDKYVKFKGYGFEKSLKTYKVDYVILDLNGDEYKNFQSEFSHYLFLILQAKIENVLIFRVK